MQNTMNLSEEITVIKQRLQRMQTAQGRQIIMSIGLGGAGIGCIIASSAFVIPWLTPFGIVLLVISAFTVGAVSHGLKQIKDSKQLLSEIGSAPA